MVRAASRGRLALRFFRFLVWQMFRGVSVVPSGLSAHSAGDPRLESLGYYQKSLPDYTKGAMYTYQGEAQKRAWELQ
jgi:hypothetical protein